MRSSWTLEGYQTPEKMTKHLETCERILAFAEEMQAADIDFFRKQIDEAKKDIEEHPDGFWKVFVKNGNYKDFCRDARKILRNMYGIEYRVQKDGCSREGVLRFIRATLG